MECFFKKLPKTTNDAKRVEKVGSILTKHLALPSFALVEFEALACYKFFLAKYKNHQLKLFTRDFLNQLIGLTFYIFSNRFTVLIMKIKIPF